MPLMGIREYGRHRGVSHVAVLKALRAGRIRSTSNGLIDSDQADRDWAHNTHPAHRAPSTRVSGISAGGAFSTARTVREFYESKLARLNFEERAASLVSADELKLVEIRFKRSLTEHMLSIPAHVVPQVVDESDEHRVHKILSTAIREALTEFADECVSGPG